MPSPPDSAPTKHTGFPRVATACGPPFPIYVIIPDEDVVPQVQVMKGFLVNFNYGTYSTVVAPSGSVKCFLV